MRYAEEFKPEAVKLVEYGMALAEVTLLLSVIEQTKANRRMTKIIGQCANGSLMRSL